MKTKTRILIFSLFAFLIYACNSANTTNGNGSDSATDVATTSIDTIQKIVSTEPEEDWTIERLYEEFPYPFDTLMKNGYHLHFEYFKSDPDSSIETQLVLMKGKKAIDILNNMGYGIVMKNLGYIGADFNDYFAFVQSYGSGNTHDVQLIRKRDAFEVTHGFIIAADEKNELLLYGNDTGDLMLYDITRRTDKLLVDLGNCDYITCMDSQLAEYVKIKKVTQKNVFLEIAQDDGKSITKKFSR